MALNFPNSPTLNQVYTDSTSGFSYQWNGTVWISFSAASSSQIKTLDDISASFNNSTLTFALTSGSVSITPPTSQSLIINLGGVIQDPTDDYSVSGSNITFSTAPTSGLSFSGVSLGPAIPVTTIPSGTVTGGSLTVAGLLSTTNLYVSGISTFVGLATHTGTIFGSNLSLTGIATATEFDISGSSNTLTAGGLNVGVATATEFDISGSSNSLTAGGLNVGIATALSVIVGSAVTINSSGINVTGITTIKNASGTVTIGIGTTALLVEGNARVTGILTVGSASITLDGTNNRINVGTGLTLSSGGVHVTGIITATSFSGSGANLTGVSAGSTVADDTSTNATFYPVLTQTTSGTITASKVSTTKLTFNPSTGTVTATTFSGALTGNSSTATSAATLTTARNINDTSFNGSANIVVNPTSGAYSNGQGAKTIQSGGVASGGSSGDIFYIY